MNVDVQPAGWTHQAAPGSAPVRQTVITFYDHVVQNEFKTEAEGRPIFETKTYVRKVSPGDRLVIIERKASKGDFARWPVEYQRYVSGNATAISGTPLEAWAQITRSQVAEYKALNIMTVEQLAEMPDSFGHNIMGFQGWKQKAQSFLQAAKGQGEFDRMQSELKKRDDEIARMKSNEDATAKMMLTMQERLAALEGDREPPKVETRRATITRP